MPENVRLVVWDLDECFWKGTLTEGGIREYIQQNHELVIELARRGIMSSICSKNDFESVKTILVEKGIWDYFIFPSIDWSPKSPRIATMIETIGLRPPTVMFVDDNPSNLGEVKALIPDIQTENETFPARMLASPLFKGKDDAGLSRLKQYKVLEKRNQDAIAAGPNIVEFLRESNIQVKLEFNVEPHLNRVIELINRTNQLNFTKNRLPEEPARAKAALLEILTSARMQCALVHVRDRYGDHGFCGVYIHDSEGRRLHHFAFSCRILGMGVERWLYQKLKRPRINVEGEVLANLQDPTVVDWITQVSDFEEISDTKRNLFGRVVARGSCDLGAVIHYFTATTQNAVGEYHEFRNGGSYRIDHSMFLRYAIEGIRPDALAAAERLGYAKGDFETRLFDKVSAANEVALLSFSTDYIYELHRHRATGLMVPFSVETETLPPFLADWGKSAREFLRDEFDKIGVIQEAQFKDNLRLILKTIDRSVRVFVMHFVDIALPGPDGKIRNPHVRVPQMNRWISEVATDFPNVDILKVGAMIESPSEVYDYFHFDRKVYYRIYQEICRRAERREVAA